MGKLFLLIKSLLLSIVMLGYLGTHANAALSAGDIAFVGFNADDNDDFAFVALVDIPSGEKIFFTDGEWNSTNFEFGEGTLQWNAPLGGIAKGSVVIINGKTPSVNIGTITEIDTDFNLGTSGDQIFAYQASAYNATPSSFLSAFTNNGSGSDLNLINTGLTLGTHAIDFTLIHGSGDDGGYFNGARSGEVSFSNYLTIVNNANNWGVESSNGANVVANFAGNFTIGGDTTPPTITSTTPADNATGVAIDANLTIVFNESVAKGSGNIYIYKMSDNTKAHTIDVAHVTLSNGDKSVTINPFSDLESNTAYYIKIDSGALKNSSNNNFSGIDDNSTWNFTTIGANRDQMVIWTFDSLSNIAHNVEIAPKTDDTIGTPTLKQLYQTIDDNGKGGVAYTDSEGVSQGAGKAIAWDDIKGDGDDAELLIAINTIHWSALELRFDYESDLADSFDLEYSVDGGVTWSKPFNNKAITTGSFQSISLDLSGATAINNQPLVLFKFSDFDNNGNDKLTLDNIEITGIKDSTAISVSPLITASSTTTSYLQLNESGMGFVSASLNDTTDPAKTLGIDFNLTDPDTAVGSLVVSATSSNQSVVANSDLALSGTGATRKLKITPKAKGTADITVTVSDSVNTNSYIIAYRVSDNSSSNARFHTDATDGSAAIAIDATYMLVADDEDQVIRVYDRTHSGLPIKTINMNSALGLEGQQEVDIEAATQIGNTIYWMGSHSNESDGTQANDRALIFKTTLSGTGASTTLTFESKYTALESDLTSWDSTNAHGLGANYYGLSASAADGKAPEATDGLSIEGLTMAPSSTTTAYLGFRAPNVNVSDRNRSLIVPITNFDTFMGATPTFGTPIELDLGGRGIRSIECNTHGCIIIAGSSDSSGNFALYTWSGDANDKPELRSATLSGEGSFEGIVELPSSDFMGSNGDTKTIQVIRDNGDTDWYGTTTKAKKLEQNNWKKFQSDGVTLGSVVGTIPSITINEVDADTAGTDVLEFIELYDGGVGNVSLDGLVLVLFNGNGDISYKAFDLDGNTTDANGFFVLGNSGVANVDAVVGNGFLENGADAVALYLASALDFPNGTAPTTTNLLDAIVYDTADADDSGLLTGLWQSTQYDENANGDQVGHSNSRSPDGNGTFVAQTPTPGTSNTPTVVTPTATMALIHEIQGSGTASPLDGQSVSVRAIVVGDFQDGDNDTKRNLRGFYIQEEDNESDGNASTSEGIFVYEGTGNFINNVNVGDWVEINGSVDEYYDETQIIASSVRVLSSGNTLPTPTIISLPTPSTTLSQASKHQPDLEAFEGMLVEFSDTLTITEMYQLGRFNEIKLTQGGRVEQFSQIYTPNPTAYTAYLKTIGARTITYDDGLSLQNGAIGNLDGFGTTFNTASDKRMGDTITHLKGVLSYQWAGNSASGATWRVRSIQEGVNNFVKANNRPATPSNVGGNLKVASLNVLNYFNTIGNTCGLSGTEECRGANDATELARQTQKLVKVLQSLDADVVGFMEIENNYHKPTPAIAYLVDALNTALGDTVYSYVPSGNVGDDVIAVGMIYKSATVKIADSTTIEILDDSDLASIGMSGTIFNGSGTNRSPLAATFEEVATGETFTFVVAHMKSKGSAGTNTGDTDLGDGAGASNGTRVLGVTALKKWLDSDPTNSSDNDFLIVGDMNAYAKEEPITYLENNGYTDLARHFMGSSAYSYVFDGQIGTLDYAFANTSLKLQVKGATEWHINADEASAIDYNTDFGRDTNIFDGTLPYRQSDHDPVVIGLKLGNSIPISKDATITLAQDATYTFGSANFYFEDNDTSDTLQKVIITSLPTKGSLKFNGTGVSTNQEINTTDIAKLTYTPISGESGSSYTSFGFKVNDGEDNSTLSYTISINVTATPPPANNAPIAGFSFVVSGLSANFIDSSTDSDGAIVLWEWSFGDGNSSTSQNPTHTYALAGEYNVRLKVTDDDGESIETTQTVTLTALTIENNTTVEDNVTQTENNATVEDNVTQIENNATVEDNATQTETNTTVENNDTIIENKGDLALETNTTQHEENTTLEANTTLSPEGNLTETLEENTTADTSEPLEQNTTQDEEIEDSVTAHDGIYAIQVGDTIAQFAHNHQIQIDEDSDSIKATIVMEHQIIEIRLNKATQTLTITLIDSLSGHAKSVTFNLKGSQTFVDEEGNISITTPTQEATHTIKTTLTPRGKVEHIVIFERQTTKALFEIDANTTMDENATLTTQTQIEHDGLIYRAIVITNSKGKSKTKFIKINKATGKSLGMHHTLRSDREFRHGSTIRVFVRNGKLLIQSKTPLDDDLMIE